MKKSIKMKPEELTVGLAKQLAAQGIELVILESDEKKGSALGLEWLCHDVKFGKYYEVFQELAADGIGVEYQAHAASYLLPRAFFGIHPYWFRMNTQGERTPDCNLCSSSVEALAYVSWRAGVLGGMLRSSTHRYHLLPDESADAVCHCPACRHLSPAEQRMNYTRAVLVGLREKDSKAEVCYPVCEGDEALPKCCEKGIFLSCTAKTLEKYGESLFYIFQPNLAIVTAADEGFLQKWEGEELPFYGVVIEK